MDLLEGELVDAVDAGSPSMPLRNRAHRARVAAEPGRAELLALLDRADLAVAAARRAAMSGDDPRAALAELAAVAELANGCHATDIAPTPTVTVEPPPAHSPNPSPVTESVTNSVAPKTRPVRREDVIDVDTVWVERGDDFEVQGTYRVLAGESILLGYLGRNQRRRWEARTATTALTVPGGPWHTRHDALVGLLLNGDIRTTQTQQASS